MHTSYNGDWAKPINPGCQSTTFTCLTRNFDLMATGQKDRPKNPGCQFIGAGFFFVRKSPLMATGQSRKPRMSDYLYTFGNEKLRIMATGQSRKTQDVNL